MGARTLRVASQLQRVLNDLLRNDVKDPRLQGVGVSAVHVSGDIGVARVYINTLDPDADPEPVMTSLERASGYLRSRVAAQLRLRHTPELRSCVDEGARRGIELTRLIEAVANDGSVGDGDTSSGVSRTGRELHE